MKALRRVLPFTMAFLFLALPHGTKADILPGEEKFLFQLGYFLPSFDTKLRVDNDDGTRGDEVNLEKDLGFDHQETTILASATWRMSPRNRLSVGYFRFHRTATKVIDKQIEIGDEVYPVNAELQSDITLNIIPISYSYSFLKTDKWEVAGTLGVQWSTITFDIKGSASAGGPGADAHVRADALAPLPLVGVDATYFMTKKWHVGGNLGVFYYKLGSANINFEGTVGNATLNTDYWFSNYVGAGVALNWFVLNLDAAEKRWDGDFKYSYFGPQIYLTGRF
ncbi:hypothetical protein D3C87_339360 [compost metagenome]